MKVIIKTIDENLVEKELPPISFSDWVTYANKNDDITLYKKIPVISYQLVSESCDIIKGKKEIIRESVKEFIQRKKSVRCAVNNCTKAGLHIGNFCNKHYEKAWRVMKKRGISFKELQALIEKRKNEK